jgi:hypothetical protein
MNTKDVLNYSAVGRLRKDLLHDIIPRISDQNNLYISEHFVERMCQRKLTQDQKLIASIIIHFMNVIFDKTTFTYHKYKIGGKNLKLCISVEFSKKFNRHIAIVKTAYDVDNEYEFDEVIELKAN